MGKKKIKFCPVCDKGLAPYAPKSQVYCVTKGKCYYKAQIEQKLKARTHEAKRCRRCLKLKDEPGMVRYCTDCLPHIMKG